MLTFTLYDNFCLSRATERDCYLIFIFCSSVRNEGTMTGGWSRTWWWPTSNGVLTWFTRMRSPQSILLNLEHSRELLAWSISSDGTSGLDLPPQLSGGLFSFSTELQTLLLPSCVFSLSEYLFVFCSSPDQLFPHSSGWRLFIPKDGSSFQATLFQSWTVEYCSLNFATCTIQIQLVCF